MTWLNTPWHHAARVKGAGVDCAQLLVACYVAVGAIDEPTIEDYPQQWNLHRGEARFLARLLDYCEPTDNPQPGDIAMFHYGRHASHGAIMLDESRIIHAWLDVGRVTITDLATSEIRDRLVGYYRLRTNK